MDDTSQPTRRRIRAVLAGGLVLGVGAAVTLAAWNDSEFAIGSFAAGQFNLVGSTDGVAYEEHETEAGAAVLGFALNPTNLAPEDVVYAPFAVALDETTTYGALVTVSATAAGTTAGLTYELLQTDTFGCGATTTGTSLVDAGTALDDTLGTITFDLDAPSAEILAPVNLCFRVTAGAGIGQGSTGSATWEFAAESRT